MVMKRSIKSLTTFAAVLFATSGSGKVSAQDAWTTPPTTQATPIRFENSVHIGNQPGVRDGFYRVGAFSGIFDSFDRILFMEGHGNINFHSGTWSGDVGLGYRQEFGPSVLGVNAFYSYREYGNGLRNHDFQTLGFGAEALMDDWAIRSNAYVAVTGRRSNGLTAFALPGGPDLVPQMGGSAGVENIRLATQTENFDEALDGFDLMLSRKLPSVATEVGAGVYYLSARNGPQSWGVNGTAEMWFTPNISGNINVSHDRLFDTTAYGGVSIYFGGPPIDVASRSVSVESRLWERVQRRHVAPVINYTRNAPDLLATAPGSGELITVARIGTGGDLVGAPNLLAADGSFVDIILVDADATFGPGDLTASLELNDGQRLLSAHMVHAVDTTEFGTIQIPESGVAGGPASLVGGAGIDLITLASNNEIAGFSLTPGDNANAIVGTDATGFVIHNNAIFGNIANASGGIVIDSSGLTTLEGFLLNNEITGAAGSGVDITGQNMSLNIANNIINGSEVDNIRITSTGHVTGMVNNNQLNDAQTGSGLNIAADTVSIQIANNFANSNAGDGILVEADAVADGQVLEILNNTANLNGGDGISVEFNGNENSEILISGNTADVNGGDGISVVYNGTGTLLGTISNNTTNGNDPGIFVQSTNVASIVQVDLSNNLAVGNQFEGIFIDAAGRYSGSITDNTVFLNGGSGLLLSSLQGDVHVEIENNIFNNNGESGIQIDLFNGNLTGTIANNSLNENEGSGLGVAVVGHIDLDVLNNTVLDNLNMINPEDSGIVLIAAGDVNGLIDGNTIAGNANGGLQLIADVFSLGVGDVGATISNNIVGISGNGNGNFGIYVEGENITGDITDNTVDANTGDGISLIASENISATISGNLIGVNAANSGDGLFIQAGNNLTGDIIGNTSSNNGGNGMIVDVGNNLTGDISNNTASGNAGHGMIVEVMNDLTGDIIGNITSGNTLDGLNFEIGNDFNGVVQDNISNGNLGNGILFDVDNILTGEISGNTANDNGLIGMMFSSQNDFLADVTGNTANDNGTTGMLLLSGDFIGDLFGNETNENADGFVMQVTGDFTGDFLNNTANDNTNFGFDTNASGSVTGTTSPNNAAGNGTDFNGNIAAP